MKPPLAVDIEVTHGDFTLRLNEHVALDGITAIFGPSGSGKSTALRALSGLEQQANGTIMFRGEHWLDSARGVRIAPHRRGVGYVFQDARLLPFLSVAGNLRYAARRATSSDGRFTLEDVIAAFDLAEIMARDVTTLSGGERQRVAIARALLTRPRLLLMDEPLSANDIRRKADLLPYVRQLPNRFGVPVIYVSHALDEVTYLADFLIVLGAGRVVATGPVDSVLERLDLGPAMGRFEAGSMLGGRVTLHDEQYQLTHVQIGEQLLVVPLVAAAVGDSIRVRIRARDVAIAVRRPTGISIRNILAGRLVKLVEEPTTAYAEALIDLGSAHIRARITRAAVADLELEQGSDVFALIKSVTVDDRFGISASAN